MSDNLNNGNDWVDTACDVMAVTVGLVGFFSIAVQCIVESYQWLQNGVLTNYSVLHFLTEEQAISILNPNFIGYNKIAAWMLGLWVSLFPLAAGLLLALFFSKISRIRP